MKQSQSIAVRSRFLFTLGFVLVGLLPASLQGQGRIESWGLNSYGQVSSAPGGTDFSQVAAGCVHSLAMRADGSIVSWGYNGEGQVADTPTGTGFTQVAAGCGHSLALHADGSIASWGYDGYGQVSSSPGGTGFTQVAGGFRHSIALRADGSIASWGYDFWGQVSNIPGGTDFIQVEAGYGHSVALRSDGSIESWGSVWSLNAPVETGFTQVSSHGNHSLALRADGSIVSWGRDDNGQVSNTPISTGFLQVAAGEDHSLALRADGSIVAWGLDVDGQVSNTPAGTGYTQVDGGWKHSIALNTYNSGNAFCFGDGSGNFCPCLNFGNAGEGCANTSGTGGARLTASGSAFLSNDTLQLHVAGVPGSKPGLILRGMIQLNGGLGNFVGDGLLCTSGQTARSQVQFTSAGSTTFSDFQGSPFGASSYPGGVPTNYQFWYRDMTNTCSGLGFNFSNAWTVTWQP